MRKPTHADAELLLRLYELRREPEFRRARQWFLSKFEPAGWEEISPRYLTHSDEDRWFRMTISYWEMVATLVNRGVLHAEIFFDHTGEDIVTWRKCEPWIRGARTALRPTYLCQFERLVKDHEAYRAHQNAAFSRRQAQAGMAAKGRPAPRTKRGGKSRRRGGGR